MTKKTSALILTALWIGTAVYSQTVSDTAAFIQAVAAINAEGAGAYSITLSGSFASGPVTFNGSAKTITIKGDETERVISNSGGEAALFTVPKGVTLILDNNITLNGNNKTAPVVDVNGGGFVMKTGSTVRGAQSSGVWISNGAFTMEGGTIRDNTAYSGGGVSVDDKSVFTMKGGVISGNTANDEYGVGGGVSVLPDSSFTMEDGVIRDNTANYNGGGVSVYGSFTMKGGTIHDNTASYYSGGGVYILYHRIFTMEGGIIRDNTASYSGGGVSVDGSFLMQGGTISGNTATSEYGNGGGVSVSSGNFTKKGGTIDNTNSAKEGKGVYVNGSPVKRRDAAAGPEVNLDSSKAGRAGGWE